mgnify:FL=1
MDKESIDAQIKFVEKQMALAKSAGDESEKAKDEYQKWLDVRNDLIRKKNEEVLERWQIYYERLKASGASVLELNMAIEKFMGENKSWMTQRDVKGLTDLQMKNRFEEEDKLKEIRKKNREEESEVTILSLERQAMAYSNDYKRQIKEIDKLLAKVTTTEEQRKMLIERRTQLEKTYLDAQKSAYERFYDKLFAMNATEMQKEKYELDKEMAEFKMFITDKRLLEEFEVGRREEIYKKYADTVISANQDIKASNDDTQRSWMGGTLVYQLGEISKKFEQVAEKTSEWRKEWKKRFGLEPKMRTARERELIADKSGQFLEEQYSGKARRPKLEGMESSSAILKRERLMKYVDRLIESSNMGFSWNEDAIKNVVLAKKLAVPSVKWNVDAIKGSINQAPGPHPLSQTTINMNGLTFNATAEDKKAVNHLLSRGAQIMQTMPKGLGP